MSGTKPVAGYEQVNNTIYDPASYKAQIDGNFMSMQRVANMFAPRAQKTPSMKVEVDPGHIWNGTSLTEVGGYCYATAQTLSSSTIPVNTTTGFANGMAFDSLDGYSGTNSQINDAVTISSFSPGVSVTLSAGNLFIQNNAPLVARQLTGTITAPSTHPRIDRIVIDAVTGLISVVTGTEAATPTPPAIPQGALPCAQVLLQTSSTSITNSMITDERCIEAFGSPPSIQSLFGQCRLVYTDTTHVTLQPFQGNCVTFPDGSVCVVPSAGIAALITSCYVNGTASQTLSASTAYNVYLAKISGSYVLDFSTTAHATDANTGIEIKSGDSTRVLVGKVYPLSGPVFADTGANRLVLSWFNRRPKDMVGTFTTDRTTTSAAFTEINSEIRVQFLCWGTDAIAAECGGTMQNSASGNTVSVSMGLDSTSSANLQMTATENANNGSIVFNNPLRTTPSEGQHYLTLLGGVNAGTGKYLSTCAIYNTIQG